MMKYYCNPLNVSYRYQFNQDGEKWSLNREAADPTMIVFKGRYYLFPSMTRGFFVSDDLVNWEQKPLPDTLPLYDYAPDVRAIGDYMYFCASRRGTVCDFYRTKDPESGVFERIEGTFDFWDPDLFLDDDGRMYFYWGCSNVTPIYGVELDPETMRPLTEKKALIDNQKTKFGYERLGEDHHFDPSTNSVVIMMKTAAAEKMGCRPEDITDIEPILQALPPEHQAMARAAMSDNPYVEGAWMTKHNGKYYLQYAVPGAQYNVYCDGVYEGDSPLGPFTPARNNPFSYSPGGFFPGAGHGSTMEDQNGNWWHTSTMRISVNHTFERRVGIWPCGFDADGELFCNQRYSDWPIAVSETKDPWQEPEWMLLSYNADVKASSEKNPASYAVNENVQNWWKAEETDENPWLMIDLGKVVDAHAVQVNFADDFGKVDLPEGAVPQGDPGRGRYIEERSMITEYLLEYSTDGESWKVLSDRRGGKTDLSHDFCVKEEGFAARYFRLSGMELPYGGIPAVSGLRVFGKGNGDLPHSVDDVKTDRYEPMSMKVSWTGNAVGYEVLFGHAPEKLYHSYRVFGKEEADIRALVDGETYYVRVDAFDENGITHGKVFEVK